MLLLLSIPALTLISERFSPRRLDRSLTKCARVRGCVWWFKHGGRSHRALAPPTPRTPPCPIRQRGAARDGRAGGHQPKMRRRPERHPGPPPRGAASARLRGLPFSSRDRVTASIAQCFTPPDVWGTASEGRDSPPQTLIRQGRRTPSAFDPGCSRHPFRAVRNSGERHRCHACGGLAGHARLRRAQVRHELPRPPRLQPLYRDSQGMPHPGSGRLNGPGGPRPAGHAPAAASGSTAPTRTRAQGSSPAFSSVRRDPMFAGLQRAAGRRPAS